MYSCIQCSELLLDFLYDLLDVAEAEQLHAHLEQCLGCREELERARGQRQLIARAAQLYRCVPVFTAPATEPAQSPPAEVVLSAQDTVVQNRETVTDPPLPSRRRTLRLAPWLAVAAALLLAVGTVVSVTAYQDGLTQRQTDYARARDDVLHLKNGDPTVVSEFQQSRKKLSGDVKARHLHLTVYGPAVYQPGAPSPIHIVAEDLRGKALAADVTVECLAPTGQNLYRKKTVVQGGQAVVPLPANLPARAGQKFRLRVAAATVGGQENVEQDLAVASPGYLTYVTTSKPLYHAGELLFFRTVTLDRFTLQPPGRAFQLEYKLVNGAGVPVVVQDGPTQAGGIGGGNFPLPTTLPDGEYTLQVAEKLHDDLYSYEFAPQTCRVLIRRPDSPQVVLEQSRYYKNDIIRGELKNYRRVTNGNSSANPGVTVTVKPAQAEDGAAKALTDRPYQTNLDNEGNASFALPLSKATSAGRVKVEVEVHEGAKDGRKDPKFSQSVPLVSGWKVDFFPEGGNLVAGVTNSVYFHVAAPPAEARNLHAELFDAGGRALEKMALAVDAPGPAPDSFSGNFRVRPSVTGAARLKVFAQGQMKVEQSLPAAQAAGVGLVLQNPVAPETTPIDCLLSPTREQTLLVVATCRGHLVDQQLVKARPQGTHVKLTAGAGIQGVICLTAYEPAAGQLIPRAERLLYRTPRDLVRFSCELASPPRRMHQPGEKVVLNLRSESSTGKALDTWAGAVVVDEQAYQVQPDATAGGLPGFFFLGAALHHPADLEQIPVLVGSSQKSQQALDRFLAIQGWRRFVSTPPAGLLARRADAPVQRALAETPPLFSRDNLEQARHNYETDLANKQRLLDEELAVWRRDLKDRQDTKQATARAAFGALHAYEELPRYWLGIGLLALWVVLLALGLFLLAAGIWRALVRRRPATLQLATAFGSLVGCIILLFSAQPLAALLDQDPGTARPVEQLARAEPPPALDRADRLDDKLVNINGAPDGVFAPIARGKLRQVRQPDLDAAKMELPTDEREKESPLVVVTAPPREQINELQKQLESFGGDEKKFAQLGQQTADKASGTKGGSHQPLAGGPGLPPAQSQNFPPGTIPNQFQPGFQAPQVSPAGAGSQPATTPAPTPGPTPTQGGAGGYNMPQLAKGADNKGGLADPRAEAKANTYFADLELRNQYFREFTKLNMPVPYANNNAVPIPLAPGTLLWEPALRLEKGTGQVSFDLPYQYSTYRILLYGHTPTGHLGFYQGQIEVKGK
jgi:hypothetical protein